MDRVCGWDPQSRYLPNAGQGGGEERLTTNEKTRIPTSFAPDGKSLAFSEYDPISGSDIWVLTLDGSGDRAARPFVKTNFAEGSAQFSPDGRWIAYQSNESGRFEIYVRSFPDGARSHQVSPDGGISAMWSGKGTELFYRSTNGRMMAVSMQIAPELRIDAPRVLFDATSFENTYSVAPDGRLLMMQLVDTEQAATEVRLVFNFLAELRQRVR